MGKILVLYDSRSGNTEKMAQLVGEGAALIPDMEVRLRKVSDAKAEDVLSDAKPRAAQTAQPAQGVAGS